MIGAMAKRSAKPLVISYMRFSTPEQAKGNSRRRQIEAAEKWAAERGLVIDDGLRLSDEGVSAFRGKNAEHGELGTFLKMVEAGRIPAGSTLIVESLDRISRAEVLTALNIFTSIIRAGVRVVTLADNREYTAAAINQNPFDLMASLIVMQRANDESRSKSLRLSDAWANRRKKAITEGQAISSRCPQWLRVEGTKYEVVPERVKVLKRIFKLVREGWGVQRIANELTGEKVPTFTDKKNRNVAKVWIDSYVQKLVKNRAVLGEYQPFTKAKGVKRHAVGEPLKGYYPQVISESEFYSAQAAMKKRFNGGGGKGDYVPLLRGLIFDSAGTPMQILNKGYGRQYRSDHTAGLPRNSTSGFPVQPFDQAVLETICSVEWFPKGQDEPDDSEAIQGRIGEIDKRLAKLTDLMTTSGDIDTLAVAARKLEDEKRGLKVQLGAQKEKSVVTSELEEWLKAANAAAIPDSDTAQRRKVAAVIAKAVERIEAEFTRIGKNYVAEVVVKLSNGHTVEATWEAVNVSKPPKRNKLGHMQKRSDGNAEPSYMLSITDE